MRALIAVLRLDQIGCDGHKQHMVDDNSDIAALSFEDALRRLEAIVHRLEAGEASLEDSIGLYAEGETLRKHCEAKLAAAQARIEKVQLGPDGRAAGLQPFDAG